jgi:hypothetical protein
VPKQHSSGGKDRLGSISKQGDRYLRSLFTAGALAVIRCAKIYGTKHRPWLTALLARRPTKVAAIALANKLARMAWAMMTRGERYKEPVALAAWGKVGCPDHQIDRFCITCCLPFPTFTSRAGWPARSRLRGPKNIFADRIADRRGRNKIKNTNFGLS